MHSYRGQCVYNGTVIIAIIVAACLHHCLLDDITVSTIAFSSHHSLHFVFFLFLGLLGKLFVFSRGLLWGYRPIGL